MINLDEIKARCEAFKQAMAFVGFPDSTNDFLCHAKSDIYALLSALSERDKEIARLTAENSHWEEINDTQAEQLGVAYGKTAELLAENKTLRNELCLHCGKYLNSHLGLCNNCRWRDSVDVNKMEG